jgi:cyclopropane-fatty-acyl-phospholipid synthase
MFLNPDELTLGEAYIYDDFDIEGNIFAAMDLADYLLRENRSSSNFFRFGMLLHKLPSSSRRRDLRGGATLHGSVHSRQRDRQAIRYHYDLPAEFYRLWLDHGMVYSCAYFTTPREDLETAQLNKLDYICRKLRLQRGDRLLDIGCGWGSLVMHAGAQYGSQATGITLSAPQAEFANARIREAGLDHLCQVEVCDYRDLNSAAGYDKLVSVGMFEHVGEKLLPQYFSQAWKYLRPGGVFLNHGIATSSGGQKRGRSFATRYVFPDGELVPISTTLRLAEAAGFEVRDVESLREHYPLTLREWVRRLEANAVKARQLTDEVTYRIWRLYMAGYARRLETGRLSVYQTLLAKPSGTGESRLPLTRSDWQLPQQQRSGS